MDPMALLNLEVICIYYYLILVTITNLLLLIFVEANWNQR
jgi:hypothetical protein